MDVSSSAAPTEQPAQQSLIRTAIAALGLVALLSIPVCLLIVLQRSGHSRLLQAGDSIPTVLTSVSLGDTVLAEIRGKRGAILFFSVDCPHCQWEIPIFNEAMKRFGTEVEFVAIALNDRQKTQMFVHGNDVRVRVLVDEKGVLGGAFGISELPALFLVNQDQRIEWVGVGEQPRSEVFRRLTILTDENQSTATRGSENSRK